MRNSTLPTKIALLLVRKPYLLASAVYFIINLSFDTRHSGRRKNDPFFVCYAFPHFHPRDGEKGRVIRGKGYDCSMYCSGIMLSEKPQMLLAFKF